MCVCEYVCVRDRESKREREYICVCVCERCLCVRESVCEVGTPEVSEQLGKHDLGLYLEQVVTQTLSSMHSIV